MILQGLISGIKNLQGGINPEETLKGDISGVIPPVRYDGAYNVIPSTTAQILSTNNKLLEDDITIDALSLKPTLLRPDAQLVGTYSYDKKIHEDEEVDLPAYTTTATTLKASSNLSPTITIDLESETFFIVAKFLTIPEYSVSTVGKGRPEYTYCTYLYDVASVPANTIATIVDPNKVVTSASNLISTTSSFRLLYWSSGSAISLYSSNGYGCYQTPTAPSVSGTTLTIKAPALAVRGSTTYFTSTYMNALTDIRYQYVIEVYKAPKQDIGLDGWTTNTLVNHMFDCVNSETHKLT